MKCIPHKLAIWIVFFFLSILIYTPHTHAQVSVTCTQISEANPLINEAECAGLQALNLHSSWFQTADACDWVYVDCYNKQITGLHIIDTDFTRLPDEIGDFPNLTYLSIFNNERLTTIPETVAQLTNLTKLHWSSNDSTK